MTHVDFKYLNTNNILSHLCSEFFNSTAQWLHTHQTMSLPYKRILHAIVFYVLLFFQICLYFHSCLQYKLLSVSRISFLMKGIPLFFWLVIYQFYLVVLPYYLNLQAAFLSYTLYICIWDINHDHITHSYLLF